MYWDAETIVAFDDLVFPNDVDEEDFRDFLDPEFYDNLLVYGPPGTGKSVLCSSIAAARSDSKTPRDLRENIVYFDCKDKEQNKKISGEVLYNELNYSLARGNGGAICFFDEIDELNDRQQAQLTAFINEANKFSRVMILATTNVDLRLKTTHPSPALVSRMSYKYFIPEQRAEDFADLVRKKFAQAGFDRSVDEVRDLLVANFGSEKVNFRDVRPLVNKLIRRMNQSPKLRIVQ
jgi:replication-associated recombination protein RarA